MAPHLLHTVGTHADISSCTIVGTGSQRATQSILLV